MSTLQAPQESNEEKSPSASRENSPIATEQGENIVETNYSEDSTAQAQQPTVTSNDEPTKPWVEIFTSPCIPAFTPSKDPSSRAPDNNNSFHGLAIHLALDRARQLNRGNRRCVAILVEVANLYDQYAQSLVKAGQTLQPAITNHLPVLSLQESLVSWSGEISKLAATLRTSICQPLQAYLVTHADVIAGLQQRYTRSRQQSFQMRQRAIHARNKYVKAVRETEQAILEWREKLDDEKKETSDTATTTTTTTTMTTPSKPNKRIASKLREVQRLESHYKRCVQRENECVKTCQRLECMALETLQTLDEDRLVIFVHSISKTVAAEKEALDEMVMSLERELGENGQQQETVVADRKGRKTIADLLKKNYSASQFDEGAGVMDADTLGLPEEIGQLRDQVKSRIAARAARVEVARTLSIFLENMASAAAKFGAGLKYQLKTNNNSPNSLRDTIISCEGPRTVALLDGLMNLLVQKAKGALALATTLRNLRSEKLDNTILYGERSLKTVADTDDAMWKQLCDAARRQTKVESRYRESTAQSAKARNRVQSMDSDSGQSAMLVHKHVSQGIANMFSILPDGGEQAMKMLDSSTRATIAQRSLEEADENEKKLRLALGSEVDATSRSLEAYKSNAEALSSHYEEEEKTGWADAKYSLEQCVREVESFRQSLQGTASQVAPMLDLESAKSLSSEVKEWVQDVESQIATKTCQPESEAGACSGFMLTLTLEQSRSVDEMLGGLGGNEEDIILNDEEGDDKVIDESIPEDAETSGPLVPDDSSAMTSVSDDGQEHHTHQWIRRRLHSTGSLHSTNSIREKLSLPKNLLRRRSRTGTNQLDAETEIFLTYFWPDSTDPERVPAVVASFACSFRDGSQPLPFQYGRLYLMLRRVIFISWTGKKLNLTWSDVLDVKETKKFIGNDKDSLIVICRKKGTSEESYMLLGGIADRQESLAVIEKVREDAKSAQEEVADTVGLDESSCGLAGVPPDDTLEKMEVVVSKHIHNISVKRFYEIVWSEGNGTEEEPFYGPWLEQECFDIDVGNWELSEAIGPWCKERYSQKRIVCFKVKRKSHLYIGPPIANVTQTQYCRVEGNDKCILSMTIEFEGVPYGDCFAVEVRWVARREGTNDIFIQVGVFVDFKKSTLMKSVIRAGTIEESTSVHKNLFRFAKAACIAAGGEEVTEEEEEAEEEIMMKKPEVTGGLLDGLGIDGSIVLACGAFLLVVVLWRFYARSRGQTELESSTYSSADIELLSRRIDQLESEIKSMHTTLNELLTAVKSRSNS